MTEYATTARADTVGYDLRGSGPAVVFVSGAGPFRATDPITTRTAELAADRGLTSVVFDRLGRGDSAAAGRLDLDRELSAIAAMIEVAGGSAVLCGHSSGCAISLRAQAAGLPVTGLILWEAPLMHRAEDVQDWTDEVERRIEAGDLEGAQEHYMKDMPPEWVAGAKASPQWPLIAAGVVTLRADGQALSWAQRALADGGLGSVDVPVLALYGTQTLPGMTEAATAVAAAVPAGASKELAGAEHSWDPEAMAAQLAEFVPACVPLFSR